MLPITERVRFRLPLVSCALVAAFAGGFALARLQQPTTIVAVVQAPAPAPVPVEVGVPACGNYYWGYSSVDLRPWCGWR